MMVQRWRISSNSQLIKSPTFIIRSCLWWFKDEEFQAIHNGALRLVNRHAVVYDGSKMKNFKQFTTQLPQAHHEPQLSMMVQRWRISSNSQLHQERRRDDARCLWWFKDEEFQAIHNTLYLPASMRAVVYDGSKMKNFKQFTTRRTW